MEDFVYLLSELSELSARTGGTEVADRVGATTMAATSPLAYL